MARTESGAIWRAVDKDRIKLRDTQITAEARDAAGAALSRSRGVHGPESPVLTFTEAAGGGPVLICSYTAPALGG